MTILKVENMAEAQMFRGIQISQGNGALILNEKFKGEEAHMIEKIIDGEVFQKDLTKIKWKKNPTIILVGKGGENELKRLEKFAPGLTKMFGPVKVFAEEK